MFIVLSSKYFLRLDIILFSESLLGPSDEMIKWKTKGTELYQKLPKECKELMRECSPLSEIEQNRKEKQKTTFDTWKKTK